MSESETPAIAGGTAAKTTPFEKAKRYGAEELKELQEALEQGTLFYAHGNKVRQLEEEFAASVGAKFAVATSSGTASIHAALCAAGISPGDEVIVPPITDMGSIAPVLYQGAVPVFADLDPRTYLMTPATVEAVMTERTRAVVAVHLWGNACDLQGLKELCDRRKVVLIEDCAQAFGCTYRGHSVGTVGDIGCFSYNEFKHISCGDGGLVVTNNEELAVRLRLSTDKGYDRRPEVTERNPKFLATNYRMTELQGAVARAQLRKLPEIVRRRRQWCDGLSEQLSEMPGLLLPQATAGSEPSWWFYLVRVVPEVLGVNADGFADALKAEGLPVAAHYIGRPVYEYDVIAKHQAFERGEHAYQAREYRRGDCPVAEEILESAVMLSINEGWSELDLEETVQAFRKVSTWYSQKK